MKWLLIVLLWAAPAEAAVDVAVPMGESAFEWKALLGEAAGWMGQVDGDVELRPAPGGWRLVVTRRGGDSLTVDVAAPAADEDRRKIAVLAVSLLQGGGEAVPAEVQPAPVTAAAPAAIAVAPAVEPGVAEAPDVQEDGGGDDPAEAAPAVEPERPHPAAPERELPDEAAPEPVVVDDSEADPFPDADAIVLRRPRTGPWQRPLRPMLSVGGGASILLLNRPNASAALGFSGGLAFGPGLRALLGGRLTLPPIRRVGPAVNLVGGDVTLGLGWSSDDRIAPLIGLRGGVGFDVLPIGGQLTRINRPLLALDLGASFQLAGPLRLDPFASLMLLPPAAVESGLARRPATKLLLGIQGTLLPVSPRPFVLRKKR